MYFLVWNVTQPSLLSSFKDHRSWSSNEKKLKRRHAEVEAANEKVEEATEAVEAASEEAKAATEEV